MTRRPLRSKTGALLSSVPFMTSRMAVLVPPKLRAMALPSPLATSEALRYALLAAMEVRDALGAKKPMLLLVLPLPSTR